NTTLDEDLPPMIMLDEIRLRQILLNIIENAVKFTAKGSIEVCARPVSRADDESKIDLIISVEDTGIGIADDDQDAIFEANLGLSLNKRLVEMMKGEIIVHSKLGVGSVFLLVFNGVEVLSMETERTTSEAPIDVDSISFEKSRVLVVDDARSNRLAIRKWLTDVNLEVSEAEDGSKALLFAKESPPELILMDMVMPVMDGYKATRELKKDPLTRDIPIIALSASDKLKNRKAMEECGIDAFLFKPVDMKTLILKVSEYLQPANAPRLLPKDNRTASNDDFGKHFSRSRITKLPELLHILQQEMKPLWENLQGAILLEELEAFVELLTKTAKRHKVEYLLNYASTLDICVQDFDIHNIYAVLKKFPTILETLLQLKETANEA
ncbi:MAG: response regulator, partial [bacterium]|nr:response regulator [bacterium]